jgi:hypothetical protein
VDLALTQLLTPSSPLGARSGSSMELALLNTVPRDDAVGT